MNFSDFVIEKKIREYYLKIIDINDSNKTYINSNIEIANTCEKIRIFKVVIELKKNNNLDYLEDLKYYQILYDTLKKIAPQKYLKFKI